VSQSAGLAVQKKFNQIGAETFSSSGIRWPVPRSSFSRRDDGNKKGTLAGAFAIFKN
jgi:hypothetical protein